MFSILFVIIGLSLLILVHEWGHFLAARRLGLLVEEFGIGFPPRLLAKKIKGTIFSLNAIPLGGFVRIYGEYGGIGGNVPHQEKHFAYQPAWKRALIILAGVLMNFLFGWLLITAVFYIGAPSLIRVDFVQADSPAAVAGLKKGDQILGFDKVDQLVNYINQNRGRKMALKIKREGREMKLTAVPDIKSLPEKGALGVGLRELSVSRRGFWASIGQGFIASLEIIAAIFAGLYQIIFSPQQVIGPVGIVNLAVDAGQLGIIYLLQFLALISLNLTVLNLLPIPALDGGRLLFIIIEKIRGRRLLLKTEAYANAIGFIILIGLIVLVTIKDIAGLL